MTNWLSQFLPISLVHICEEYAERFDLKGEHLKQITSDFIVNKKDGTIATHAPMDPAYVLPVREFEERLKAGIWCGSYFRKLDLDAGWLIYWSQAFDDDVIIQYVRKSVFTWKYTYPTQTFGTANNKAARVKRKAKYHFHLRVGDEKIRITVPKEVTNMAFFNDTLLFATYEGNNPEIVSFDPLTRTLSTLCSLPSQSKIDVICVISSSSWMCFSHDLVVYWKDNMLNWCLPPPPDNISFKMVDVFETPDGQFLCQTKIDGAWILEKTSLGLTLTRWKPNCKWMFQLEMGVIMCYETDTRNNKPIVTAHGLESVLSDKTTSSQKEITNMFRRFLLESDDKL